ncbi:MAG: hypothetical protein ACRDTH_14510 [Pseudonocardiaceae bacterium]
MRTTVAGSRGLGSAGLAVATLVAVWLAAFVTNGLVDVVLLVLAVGLMIVSYAVRRSARDELLYRNRDDR